MYRNLKYHSYFVLLLFNTSYESRCNSTTLFVKLQPYFITNSGPGKSRNLTHDKLSFNFLMTNCPVLVSINLFQADKKIVAHE